MKRFTEALGAGREAFRRERTRRGSLAFFLSIGIILAIVNLLRAYYARSIFDAVVAIVLWLIALPLLGRWMYPKKLG